MHFMPRPRVRGFTLVEQLGVIALIGATSAGVLPRLAELRTDADTVALASLAATASSVMWVNQGACLATGQVAAPGKCTVISDCAQLPVLLAGGLPPGFRVEPGLIAAHRNGVEAQCVVVHGASGARTGFLGLSAGH